MPKAKLTKRIIDAAKPGTTDLMIWDIEVRGFGFKLTPKGHRSFVYIYRGPDGKQRKPTIGRYGILTVEQARDEARKLAFQVQQGRDPSLERQLERTALTLSDLCDRYLEDHCRPKNKPRTVEESEGMIAKYIKPNMGSLRVKDVSGAHIAKFHSSFKEKKTTANRCVSVLSKMMNLAEMWELRPRNSNPCKWIERYPEVRRERFLSSVEIARLNRALDQHEPASPFMVAAVRLLLLTGARSSEIKTLKWSYIDLEHRRINLPDTKTGKRSIPITDPVHRVLAAIPRMPGSPWVIAGRTPDTHVQDFQKFWQRVRKAAKLEDVRIHDLRHTFASFALAENMSLKGVGDLLGHSQAATTARYAHIVDSFQRENANKVASVLDAALGGQPAPAAE